MADVQFGIRYANFWTGDGGGVVKGLLSAPEEAAADGVISLDELTSWTLDWTGNDTVPSFTLSSEDGSASALVDPSGFSVGGDNTPFDGGSDVDGLDQGLYEAGSGDQIIDLGALIVEDFAAGGFTEGTASDGSISVGELIDVDILYAGFDSDGTIEGTLTVIDADAEDGLITLDELIGWEFSWTGNDDVAAFSISSDDGDATALLPDNGFSLTDQNTAVDADFNDTDGLDQGLYESGSGEQIIDLGALIVEDLAAGTLTVGDADEVGIFVGPLVEFDLVYTGFWDGNATVIGSLTTTEAAAADGLVELAELVAWDLSWSGNDDVAAFSISSEECEATALLPDNGFLLNDDNTAIDPDFNDADGVDQGVYESGEQIIDLGALIIEDVAAGALAVGDASEGSALVGTLVDFEVLYKGFWGGNAAVEGTITTTEAAAADGVIELDELAGWEFSWTGNDDVSAFSISSEEGEAIALLPDNGFLLNDDNTAIDAAFNDADGVDQGLYVAGDQIIDLGALIIEDVAAGTIATGDAAEGSVLVGTFVDFDVEYAGFWGDDTSVEGVITTTEAAAADGLIEVNELAGWSFDWSGNEDVAAFSISSEDGDATALLSPSGFLLDGSNTPVDVDFNDEDGTDQGIYESGDQVIDLGALIIEDADAGTFTQGTAPGVITVDGESNEIEGPDTPPIELPIDPPTDPPTDPPLESKGELVGFASLDADTFAEGPESGADNGRVDAVNRIQPIDANGRTGPFDGQPVQGFSAVQFAPDSDGGTYWFLSDNGFGGESNSTDYLLRLYQVAPSFNGQGGDGSVEVEGFVELRDPNGLIPFDIENEGSDVRLLTGSDFDIESFVLDANGDIWVGEEFGPYLLHFDSTGVLLEAPIATPNPVELNTLNGQEPLVIGHRGASGDFPEHTLEAYRAAIAAGADFVEPDVVITKDGVLIARHEPMLDDTTNVAEVFGADRMSTKMLDGAEVTAYFAEDFTLEEIKQLRAVQSRDFRDASFDGLFEIPTLEEVIELVQSVEAETGVQVGIYPETKHPTFFDDQGLSLEEPWVQLLQDTGFTDGSRIFIQSFEISNLLDLQGLLSDAGLSDVPLVQLFGDTEGSFINDGGGGFSVPYDVVANQDLTDAEKAEIYGDLVDFIDFENPGYGDLANQEAIDVIGTYAAGLGPWKNNIFLRESLDTPVDGNGDGNAEITSQLTGEVVPLFEFAHNAGMQIHPYTLRDEERFLTLNPDGTPQTPEQEFEQFIAAGIDGFFTDFPRTGDPVRDKLVADEVRSPNNPDFDFNTLNGQTPLVIGHRGASGDFPEHTLEAYRLAIYQGADFVEPDLVITSDGVLIARHEPILDDTTNVAEVFGSDRMSTKMLDGQEVTAYFAEDFTLAEIKQLRAVQSRPYRNQEFNGEFEIPTFAEVLALVNEVSDAVGRDIGVYPETKHPTFFDEQGLSLEEPLVEALIANDFTDPNRIFIQSFEISNLLDLRNNLLPDAGLDNLKLVQLFGDTEGSFINDGGGGFSVPYDVVANKDLTDAEKEAIYGDLLPFLDFENPGYDSLANAEAITEISTYADGVGPWKNNILLRESIDTPVDGNGDGVAEIGSQLTGEVVPLIDWAHDAGLQIHPYTLRDEERFLTLNEDGTPQTTGEEFQQLIELGVDGFFTDFPETGRIVVEQYETAEEFANLRGSRGYEGMAFSPDRQTLYPMLEGTVFGDPEASLRIYEFDVATSSFEGILGLYQMDDSSHAIGDFTPINEDEFLVIERDGKQGADAAFKKIFKVDLSDIDADGFVEKEEVVDLLNIADPNDLNGDGDTTFSFPFVTIEDVLVLDAETILVANDNNYPFSIGRDFSGAEIDNNEIIQIKLAEPLELDDRLGVAGLTSGGTVSDDLDFDAGDLPAGTVVPDQFSGLTISADGFGAMLFDTANPTGDDTDLASDTLGNVLILSEDGNSDNPNDSATGGIISFVWDSAVDIDSIGFLDAEESGQITVKLFGSDGASLGTIAGSGITEDGGTGSLDIGVSDVSRMDVRLVASSAITDVTYL